jgi:hypothetical protein
VTFAAACQCHGREGFERPEISVPALALLASTMTDSPLPHAASPAPNAAALHQLGGDHHVPFSRPPTPTHKEQLQVGFIGLGAMGHFMARNLANNRTSHPAGSPPVVVWNRTLARAEALVKEVGEDKMRAAQSPAEVATECDIIVTNLASDEVVLQMFEEFAKALTVSSNIMTWRTRLILSFLRLTGPLRTRYLSRPRRYVMSLCHYLAGLIPPDSPRPGRAP